MLLTLENVSKKYGTRTILKSVSLNIYSGGISLILGKNGAGKSSLLKLMAGLTKPSSGKIEQHCRISYLGHETCVYGDLTAYDNLVFWQKLYGLNYDKKHILSMLERVGLKKMAYEPAKIFSRGMSQRLNLARVLLQEADLLLLDEPRSGLDANSALVLDSEIESAKKRGVSVVMVTHNIEYDMKLADRMILIEKQKLAFDGSKEDYEASIC